MKLSSSSKILICDFGKSLHTDHYLSALCQLSFNHVIQKFPEFESNKSPSLLLNTAKKLNCDNILVITGDKVMSIGFLRIFNRFRNSRIPVYLFYFNYHKFHSLSLKTFLFIIFLLLSSVKKIYISDPRIKFFTAYRLSSKFNFICDFHDLLSQSRTIYKSYFTQTNETFTIKKTKPIVISFLGRLTNKKGLNILLPALVAYKSVLNEHKISFIFKGLMSDIDFNVHKDSIKLLDQLKIATFDFRFIGNDEFINALEKSDFCWCVQPNFHASSGVFTQAVALNSVPIVAAESTLDYICKLYKFGVSVKTDEKRFNHDFPDLLSSILNYRSKFANCHSNMLQYSINNSKEKFLAQLESSL